MNYFNKKFLILVFLMITFSFSAQRGRKNLEKIKSLKVAFFTENLNLSADEAAKFWPIYNVYDEKLRKLKNDERRSLRDKIKIKNGIDNLTESDAKKLVATTFSFRKKIYKAELEMTKALSEVISQKKIIKLQIAEHDFRRKLIGKLKNRRND